ncbi:MAG: hypothetical protein MJ066_06305 [Clostridia bacterium]|nr:hypothetical protein [Clostridia bacterium]
MGLNNTKDRNIDKKFDFAAPPKKWKWYLRPLAWGLCVSELVRRHSKLKRINTEGVKPPYLLLCTHAAFLYF